MEDLGGEEYSFYWETQTFLEAVELESLVGFSGNSLGIKDEGITSNRESSPTDGSTSTSSTASKNVTAERNRRRKLTETLYNLRSVVPNISKMDKISILEDAMSYIQKLQEEEKKILAEVAATAGGAIPPMAGTERSEYLSSPERNKRRKTAPRCESTGPSIEVIDLQVTELGETNSLVSIRCHKRRGAMAKLCETLDSLDLNIHSANISSLSGQLLYNLIVEADQTDQRTHLKETIESAIQGLVVHETTSS